MDLQTSIDILDPVFTIGITAKRLGVSPETLRLYEKAGLLVAYRTKTGRRLYSQRDLEWIACIRRQIQEHKLNLAGIRRLLALIPCWDLKPCSEEERVSCPAFLSNNEVCWSLEETGERCKGEDCRICPAYLSAIEVGHLKERYEMTEKSDK